MTETFQPSLTPREIVSELDRYIIGQKAAKRAVAIALRNRWRRQQITSELRQEITPKNIILIGPTGVGKTEVARRLAKLAKAPFVKVEASKFTEVGYVGRDVESMVRDLVEVAIDLVRAEEEAKIRTRAKEAAEDRVIDLLPADTRAGNIFTRSFDKTREGFSVGADGVATKKISRDREETRRKLRNGEFDHVELELEVVAGHNPMMQVFTQGGMEEMDMSSMFGGLFPNKKAKRKLKVKDALRVLEDEEAAKLIDKDQVISEALERAQNDGIIFLDEIDKVAGKGSGHGPDVSRGGVQRDLLPIVEGSTVRTKHGLVKTDHILFVAAGAFHVAKPSDLLPELQGRFPIRVELESLTESDFVKILSEPQNSLVKQYTALLQTEQVELEFTRDGIAEVAKIAAQVNTELENIGARRLHTVMERLLDELSYKAPELQNKKVVVDQRYVREALSGIVKDTDLSRYIL